MAAAGSGRGSSEAQNKKAVTITRNCLRLLSSLPRQSDDSILFRVSVAQFGSLILQFILPILHRIAGNVLLPVIQILCRSQCQFRNALPLPVVQPVLLA